jgi:hypothetical protein
VYQRVAQLNPGPIPGIVQTHGTIPGLARGAGKQSPAINGQRSIFKKGIYLGRRHLPLLAKNRLAELGDLAFVKAPQFDEERRKVALIPEGTSKTPTALSRFSKIELIVTRQSERR